MALDLFGVPLACVVELRCQTLDARDGVERELEAVDIVEHAHVEGRGGGAFFLVAADVKVVMIVAAIGEPVDDPGVAVEGEDDGLVGGEERVELVVA